MTIAYRQNLILSQHVHN